MSNSHDNEEQPDMIEITLNFENKREEEEIEDDFEDGDLEKLCKKDFGIDLDKYDITFKYFDKKSDKKEIIIPDCISAFYDPYKFSKGNDGRLMIYVETKLKKEIREIEKKLEETKNKYNKLCADIDDLNKENDTLEKKIKEIKELNYYIYLYY